ncbi:unnamed protein product [Pedinophyceae sp. YPF-701]|nr:unnamed protein product [Pedinophyceae sp. YPF-701]
MRVEAFSRTAAQPAAAQCGPQRLREAAQAPRAHRGVFRASRRSLLHGVHTLRANHAPLRLRCPAAATQGAQASSAEVIQLEGAAPLRIFGVDHRELQLDIAESIIKDKVQMVVVETAIGMRHGYEWNNALRVGSMTDEGLLGDMMLAMFANAGLVLRGEEDKLTSELWQTLRANPAAVTEHLVAIAAIANDAEIVFADRPKDLTYKRILADTSAKELDAAYSWQARHNYLEMAAGHPLPRQPRGVVDRVMIEERDTILAATAAARALSAPADGAPVVCVVGASHLPGMLKELRDPARAAWTSAQWEEIARPLLDVPAGTFQDLLRSSPTGALGAEETAVKRALLEATLRLQVTDDVLQDLATCLGDAGTEPGAAAEAYGIATETYYTSQMMMASVERDVLDKVCQGWPRGTDMWEVLDEVRRVKPSQGGRGFDFQVLDESLRCMHYNMPPPQNQA